MRCFIDESWGRGTREENAVLAGVVGNVEDFDRLDSALYAVRRKYYGTSHARDLQRELKGKDLFSKASFAHAQKGFARNLTVAREMLSYATESGIRVVGVTVYGNVAPELLSPKAKQLERPFLELCRRVSCQVVTGRKCALVFDQRLGAQQQISIAVKHYLAGIPRQSQKLHPDPFIGVSNVFAGIQLADCIAYILGRYAAGDDRFREWYRHISRMQTSGMDHRGRKLYGLVRLQWDGAAKYVIRQERLKK
jgi:hypothetical protein